MMEQPVEPRPTLDSTLLIGAIALSQDSLDLLRGIRAGTG
jgi:hypothetical protein